MEITSSKKLLLGNCLFFVTYEKKKSELSQKRLIFSVSCQPPCMLLATISSWTWCDQETELKVRLYRWYSSSVQLYSRISSENFCRKRKLFYISCNLQILSISISVFWVSACMLFCFSIRLPESLLLGVGNMKLILILYQNSVSILLSWNQQY